MKISIIGAGNVGGLAAMRIAETGLAEVFLFDIAKPTALGKVFDMEDARLVLKADYNIKACEDIDEIKDSAIIVITAGLARKPGMTRDDLLLKNAQILKEVCLHIKNLAPKATVIIVTNPVDLMTHFALQITGFPPNRIFGMGVSLDASRFANLISKELTIPVLDIDACVIGSHGEGMLPLARFSRIKDVSLDEFMDEQRINTLITKTIDRGKEIVSLLGSGSAYFAPSAAITEIVRIIVKDEKRTLGVSAYLNGEYGIKDVCIGVSCCIGKNGIERIVELDLNEQERRTFLSCADKLKEQYKSLVASY